MSDSPVPDTHELTDWHCHRCDMRGRIEYAKGASVYEVINILEDAHAATAPSCDGGLSEIRVTPVSEPVPPRAEEGDAATPPTPRKRICPRGNENCPDNFHCVESCLVAVPSVEQGSGEAPAEPAMAAREITETRTAAWYRFKKFGRNTRIGQDAETIVEVCDSHERLRSAHASRESEVVGLRAERSQWVNRFGRLMDACGWDISFNIDRSIGAMIERLSAARATDASPPTPREQSARESFVTGYKIGAQSRDLDALGASFDAEAEREADEWFSADATDAPPTPPQGDTT